VRILIVAATAAEIDPLVAGLRFCADGEARVTRCKRGSRDVDVLTTGVGMVATAAWCSRVLAMEDVYDMALNVGLCGSFDASIAPGSVVHVITEQLPELGAEDDRAFLSVQELGLLENYEFPFQAGRLLNAGPPLNEVLLRLPGVHGITVNTVHGNEQTIAAVRQRCSPQVESMEGAAFMYACLMHQIPFAEVRAVSNVVERRNRGAWKITEAIDNLNAVALQIIDHA
jgi:futalosine hydrolase